MQIMPRRTQIGACTASPRSQIYLVTFSKQGIAGCHALKRAAAFDINPKNVCFI